MVSEGPAEQSEVSLPSREGLKKSELIEELFVPHFETDQAGFQRKIYKYNDVIFSFRGREEAPTYPAITDSNIQALGLPPVHLDLEEFNKYNASIEKSALVGENKPAHYLATKDLFGVISLAIKLGATKPTLPVVLEEIKTGVYSDRALELMDQLIACNWVADKVVSWVENQRLLGSDAEAIVLASLLGSQEAKDYISQQLEKLRQLDREREQALYNELERNWQYQEEFSPVDITKLVGVHTTRYLPREMKDGGYEVPTTGDATGWQYLRNTVHISLNHKVRGHLGGHWDDTPYTLIAPFRSMLERNGDPTCINELDTWWSRNPGETLKFPDASLVAPGEVPKGELFVIKGERTSYRAGDYSLRDLDEIDKEWSGCWEDFQTILLPYPTSDPEGVSSSPWDYDKLAGLFIKKYFPEEEDAECAAFRRQGGPHHRRFREIMTQGDKNTLVREKVHSLLKEASPEEAFNGSKADFERALTDLSSEITKAIESRLLSKVSEMAINQTIIAKGFPLTKDLKGQTGSLGRRFKASTDAAFHFHSIYSLLTGGHRSYVSEAMIGEDENQRFEWTKFNPYYHFPASDPKQRRVVYASGAFNSRFPS